MVFSPDGYIDLLLNIGILNNSFYYRSKVASSHGDHNINVTDLRTNKCISTLSGHPRTPWCIAFHPHRNDILASGCLGGQVRVWDLHVRFPLLSYLNYFKFNSMLNIYRVGVRCGQSQPQKSLQS